MKKNVLKIISLCFVVLIVFACASSSFAETNEERKARLERELAAIEAEIKVQEGILKQQQQQTGSIAADLNKIKSEISAKKLEIKKKVNLIDQIADDIDEKSEIITDLTEELQREKSSLAAILRRTHEIDSATFLEFMASNQSVSEMFFDVDMYQRLQGSLYKSFERIVGVKELTAQQKKDLEEKRIREANIKYTLEQDKKKVELKEGEKSQLLTISKTKEKSYEEVLKDRRAKAAQVRAALFELRGQAGIQFGDAYDYAKVASAKTGVRPAFILAILTQESSLGKNVGTCNRPGDTRTWKTIMPGPNDNSWRDDQTIFLDITKRLGISPDGQPLSCPMASGGWGGAMGPSQFIPTTWKSYENRVAAAVGAKIANPWNPAHAITATALYVQDLGANAKTYTAEREAACKYYSGRGCSAPGVQNAFYGDAVMRHATNIQTQIDVLESI